ncbi:MAG: chromophore lyase CpcT/CpeT [Pseudomonadota bacterium]
MTRWVRRGGLLLLALAWAGGVVADDAANPVARDLKILTQWFAGEFDNEEQVWFENDPRSATSETDRHLRIHTAHRRLDLPALGDHVFYVEEYRDNDPASVFRQRLVIFDALPTEGVIRMRQGFLRDAAAARGAHLAPEKLAGLTPDGVQFMKDIDPTSDCTVRWRRVADHYEGQMTEKTCQFGEGDERRYSVHNMVLSANKYWREDGSYFVADDRHKAGNQPGSYTQLRRARSYLCDFTFRGEDGRVSQTAAGLRLLNQGGQVEVTRESDGQRFTALLRNKEYPYYEERPDFLYFSFRETGAARSMVYTVNDADSRRFGFNTQGIGAHCHLEGYSFRESLTELEPHF